MGVKELKDLDKKMSELDKTEKFTMSTKELESYAGNILVQFLLQVKEVEDSKLNRTGIGTFVKSAHEYMIRDMKTFRGRTVREVILAMQQEDKSLTSKQALKKIKTIWG